MRRSAMLCVGGVCSSQNDSCWLLSGIMSSTGPEEETLQTVVKYDPTMLAIWFIWLIQSAYNGKLANVSHSGSEEIDFRVIGEIPHCHDVMIIMNLASFAPYTSLKSSLLKVED